MINLVQYQWLADKQKLMKKTWLIKQILSILIDPLKGD